MPKPFAPVTPGRVTAAVAVCAALVAVAWLLSGPALWTALRAEHGMAVPAAVVLTVTLCLVPVAPLGVLVALREHSVRLGARTGAVDALLVVAHLVYVAGFLAVLVKPHGFLAALLLAVPLAQEALTVGALRLRLHTSLAGS
ncbi:hypothetical protein [Streptomyces antibioticus]|uniref:hypothetical protein n=1 Tax=Streptomyces antibioticus TaxID=1890 RepID=UPI003D72F117